MVRREEIHEANKKNIDSHSHYHLNMIDDKCDFINKFVGKLWRLHAGQKKEKKGVRTEEVTIIVACKRLAGNSTLLRTNF